MVASDRFIMYYFYVEINQGHMVWLLLRGRLLSGGVV